MVVFCQRGVGRLGNQLFYNAHFAACAIEHDFQYVNPVFGYQLDWFPKINSHPKVRIKSSSDSKVLIRHKFLKLLNLISGISPFHEFYNSADQRTFVDIEDQVFVKSARKKIIFCDGFGFRAFHALRNRKEMIKDLFSPSIDLIEEVSDFQKEISDNDQFTLIGLHIRKTDYREYEGGKYYFADTTWLRIIQDLEKLFRDHKKVLFVVFSDENLNYLSLGYDNVIFASRSMLYDLTLMSKMDYLLGPPSTFSGWASFIGNVPILRITSEDTTIELSAFHPVTG